MQKECLEVYTHQVTVLFKSLYVQALGNPVCYILWRMEDNASAFTRTGPLH